MSGKQPPPPNVWRVKGATLSLSNAIAQYGVTEEWLKEAKLEYRMVSNRVTKAIGGFPVYIRADVERVALEKKGSLSGAGAAACKDSRDVVSQAAAPESQRAGRAVRKQAPAAKLSSEVAAAEEAGPPSPAPAGQQGGKAKGGRAKPAAASQPAARGGRAKRPAAAAAQPAAKRGRAKPAAAQPATKRGKTRGSGDDGQA